MLIRGAFFACTMSQFLEDDLLTSAVIGAKVAEVFEPEVLKKRMTEYFPLIMGAALFVLVVGGLPDTG